VAVAEPLTIVVVALEVLAAVLGIQAAVAVHNLDKHKLFAPHFFQAVHILIAVILAEVLLEAQVVQVVEPLPVAEQMPQAAMATHGQLLVIHMVAVAELVDILLVLEAEVMELIHQVTQVLRRV
jgi:hypothetical protein